VTAPGHIRVHGDPDPGGGDGVAGDVAGAVTAAMDRRSELASDTFGQGSVIGDLMDLPPVPGAQSKHTGPA
jgi:hypothetical protein